MKKKKNIFIIILFLLVCGIGVSGSIIWMRKGESITEEEIIVKENQSLIVAQINTINGNEITFAEAEEMDLSSAKDAGTGVNKGGAENSENQNESSASEAQDSERKNISSENAIDGRQMPQGQTGDSKGQFGENMSESGTRPDGDALGGRAVPSRSMTDSGNASGGDMPDREMFDSNGAGRSRTENGDQDKSGEENGKTKERTMYRITGAEQTRLIPVGTTVTTQFGTTTTFSRLVAGDIVKILMEKNEKNEDVIVGIWMIQ